ncbi:hypothetical protein Bca52824_018373 [Brassica carinata]|uniref:Uncharacterized protein n=1 Tax=Brassica carinata TaxID=52824 RepID=A0A8X7VPV0_BRACI|nr:hypothetical protein Bca52824_018373 [Brassica carinata]
MDRFSNGRSLRRRVISEMEKLHSEVVEALVLLGTAQNTPPFYCCQSFFLGSSTLQRIEEKMQKIAGKKSQIIQRLPKIHFPSDSKETAYDGDLKQYVMQDPVVGLGKIRGDS